MPGKNKAAKAQAKGGASPLVSAETPSLHALSTHLLRIRHELDSLIVDSKHNTPTEERSGRLSSLISSSDKVLGQVRGGIDALICGPTEQAAGAWSFQCLRLIDKARGVAFGLADPRMDSLWTESERELQSEILGRLDDKWRDASNVVAVHRDPKVPVGPPVQAPSAMGEPPETDQLKPIERAIAYLVSDPGLRNVEIARLVGVHPKTVYNETWLQFRIARKAIRGNLPRGSKSADGDLEAIDPDTDE